MGEVVNVVVAFAVIVFLFRWMTSGSDADKAAVDTLGFRPKTVTPAMIETISNMFPDIPPDNVKFDLLRTGSVEVTTNKILERGFLEAPPPAYFTLYPRNSNPTPATRPAANATGAKPKPLSQNLINRYGLHDRIASSPPDATPLSQEEVGGKAVWEDTPEKREASLRERKAQLILAARQRMLAQQREKKAASTSSS